MHGAGLRAEASPRPEARKGARGVATPHPPRYNRGVRGVDGAVFTDPWLGAHRTPMKPMLLAVVLSIAAAAGEAGAPGAVRPFESESRYLTKSPIDALVAASLRRRGIRPARVCSDAVFLRRVYLDVTGTLPEPAAVRGFLQSRHARKRSEVIESLLKREAFADYWALKWCDLLRVKAEFPINLWPNAVQAYHRWLREAVRTNMPYDEFARALLTSSGSNFRVPPVNFYRAIQGKEPSAVAGAVALTFMGTRMASLPEARQAGLTALFSRVGYKGTAEWKEEIVSLDPAATTPLEAVLPDGMRVRVAAGEDPRRVFADWLIAPENPWFARSIVNRVWAWLLGRGIIHEPDDIRPDNPPANPRLLAYLERELVKADYDLRHLYRLILNSRTYQQSPIPRSKHRDAEKLFAHYIVRRLDAEVLIDALCWIAGDGESYSSAIPEPFTFIPERHRTVELADGSITSQFLEMFGRPARDTGLESERNTQPTAAQRLHRLNSTHIQSKIERSKRLGRLARGTRGKPRPVIHGIYLTILSRWPVQAEVAAAEKYFKDAGLRQGAVDLAWALVNTKEFSYKH